MATLHEIHAELKRSTAAADRVRRKHLKHLYRLTGRPTIVYASSFTVKDAPGAVLQISRADVQSFMSALVGVAGPNLDLIVHSGGGSAEATEQIVNYLRSKFSDIRVIVPQNAMSAATMLACASNRIVMGKHSALGPIDPQLILGGQHAVAAQSILDEFVSAQQNVNHQGNNPILWIQKVQQYPPGILVECQKVIQLARQLVEQWMKSHMFAQDPQGPGKASSIAQWLSNNTNFLTHGRSIGIAEARTRGLVVDELEANQDVQEAVLSVFHSTVATFQTTHCVKLVENHLGKGSFALVGPVAA